MCIRDRYLTLCKNQHMDINDNDEYESNIMKQLNGIPSLIIGCNLHHWRFPIQFISSKISIHKLFLRRNILEKQNFTQKNLRRLKK